MLSNMGTKSWQQVEEEVLEAHGIGAIDYVAGLLRKGQTVTEIAPLLGVERSRMYYWMHKNGIVVKPERKVLVRE